VLCLLEQFQETVFVLNQVKVAGFNAECMFQRAANLAQMFRRRADMQSQWLAQLFNQCRFAHAFSPEQQHEPALLVQLSQPRHFFFTTDKWQR
jgi:hypothetical protein